MIVEIGAAGSGMDEHQMRSRGTGTYKWRLDYTARQGETLTFNWVKVSISFNFMFFFMIRDDPS